MNTKKIFNVLFFSLFIAIFFIAKKADAYQQLNTTGWLNTIDITSSSTNVSQLFGNFSSVSVTDDSFYLLMKLHDNGYIATHPNCYATNVFSINGGISGQWYPDMHPAGATSGQTAMPFDTPVWVKFSRGYGTQITNLTQLNGNSVYNIGAPAFDTCGYQGLGYDLYVSYATPNPDSTHLISMIDTTGTTQSTYALTFSIDSGTPPPPDTSASIEFQNPPFFDGMTSVNFKNWILNLHMAKFASTTLTQFNLTVDVGTSTPYGLSQDSLSNSVGGLYYSNAYDNLTGVWLPRQSSTTPGSYKAIASIVDQNGTVIATSTVLNFGVTGDGTVTIDVPAGSTVGISYGYCAPTTFQVFGADIGQGVCNLIFPGQATLDKFATLKNEIASTAPFSYFYDGAAALSNLSVTSTSLVSLTITLPTSSPVHFSADMFSSNTINKYTSPTSRLAIRTIIEYSFYLAFLTMVIFEIRHLFKKHAT